MFVFALFEPLHRVIRKGFSLASSAKWNSLPFPLFSTAELHFLFQPLSTSCNYLWLFFKTREPSLFQALRYWKRARKLERELENKTRCEENPEKKLPGQSRDPQQSQTKYNVKFGLDPNMTCRLSLLLFLVLIRLLFSGFFSSPPS